MSLLRRAIDLIPKTNGPAPPYILSLFLRTAPEAIDHYVAMSRRRVFVVHTRSYFHMMFVSGVSAVYCVAASLACPGADVDAATAPDLGLGQDVITVARGMRVCEEVLVVMSEQLPGASAYVTVFGALRRHITRRLQLAVPHAAHDLALLDSAPVSAPLSDAGPEADAQGPPRQVQVMPSLGENGENGLAGPECQPPGSHDGLQSRALGYGAGNNAANHPAYDWMGDHGQHHASASAPDFSFHQPALGAAMPIDPRAGDGLGPAGIQQLPQLPQEELLQWVFTNDESMLGMDSMLGEYVYGDPSHGGLFNRMDL